MKKFEIIRGQEFKIKIYPEITEDNIFWKEYCKATSILYEIVTSSRQDGKQDNVISKFNDYENNIIAFCGERGEGKSSATFSFANAIANHKNNCESYVENELFNNITFSSPIIVDPGMFDEVHNILDVILAHLYKRYSEKASKENDDYTSMRERDQILDQFQKVYRYVSLIANQEKILDDEYDYEGNIGKLSKLGESTQIKKELIKLISLYLRYVEGVETGNGQLVIAIDDLDLCSSNAYKMSEQIRKYLIIPNVVILMSVRIEQLTLCVEEKNLSDFPNLFKSTDRLRTETTSEIRSMSEKYISKLIPLKRRIYLPRIQAIQNIYVEYKDQYTGKLIWNSSENKSLVEAILQLIRKKTGMYFLETEGNVSYLLPDNMRAMINWITMLSEMKDAVTEQEYLENIELFYNYYIKELENGLTWKYKSNIQNIEYLSAGQMFNTVNAIICDIMNIPTSSNTNEQSNYTGQKLMENGYSLCLFTNWFANNLYTVQNNTLLVSIYMLRTLYTIKLNILKIQSKKFGSQTEWSALIGGYIWGWGFSNTLPTVLNTTIDRSRFQIGTAKSYNIIYQYINNCEEDVLREGERVSRINRLENSENYSYAWIVLAMLGNVYYNNNYNEILSYYGTFIYDNSILLPYVHISLENYLYSLGNLEYMYDKINMDMLGVSKESFIEYIRCLAENNKKSISAAKTILFNMDIMVGVINYLRENKVYNKNGAQDERKRTSQFVDSFFEKITTYLNNIGIDISIDDLKYFHIGKQEQMMSIDISDLYGILINESLTNLKIVQHRVEDAEGQKKLEEFRDKITHTPKTYDKKWHTVSTFLKNKSVQNALINMDYLAQNIQRYIGVKKEFPDFININALCGFYSQLLEFKIKNNETTEITEDMVQAYKNVAKINKEIIG